MPRHTRRRVRRNPGVAHAALQRQLGAAFAAAGLPPEIGTLVMVTAEFPEPIAVDDLATLTGLTVRQTASHAAAAAKLGLLTVRRINGSDRYGFDRLTFWDALLVHQLRGIAAIGDVFAKNLPRALPPEATMARLRSLYNQR